MSNDSSIYLNNLNSSFNKNDEQMAQELEVLKTSGNFRSLKNIYNQGKYILFEGSKYLNFSSNSYLGLSETNLSEDFFTNILEPAHKNREFFLSNPASRLMTGNSFHYDELENLLGQLYGNRKALILSSGFLVNAGILPALTHKGDLILADKLVHASIIDGIRLSEAEWKRFKHNDIEHLETLLRAANGRSVWVVTESIFSMDGDIAPLKEIVELKKKYHFNLYIDEAHAFGVVGPNGIGIAAELGILDYCDIIVATFGKAIDSAGAFIISNEITRHYLINKMRTLIFSTALPPICLMWTKYIVERLTDFEPRRQHLKHLRKIFSTLMDVQTTSQIIPLYAGTNEKALMMANIGKNDGFWLTPIRHPTVPQGTARIRISLTAAMTEKDIINLCQICKKIG